MLRWCGFQRETSSASSPDGHRGCPKLTENSGHQELKAALAKQALDAQSAGYPIGCYVRYRSRSHRNSPGRRSSVPTWTELTGTVTGRSLLDLHTSTTWVPVRSHDAALDTPARLVRAADILDSRLPA
jgi:hypothetical protein